MGLLVQGKWVDQWYDTKKTGGKFVRQDSAFRDWIGSDKFPAEKGRYHLYVSLACPWAHRTLIFRALKDLTGWIGVTVVSPDMLDKGWQFDKSEPLYGYQFAHQLYTHAKAYYTGRVSVPILWDKKLETIVNNESSDIIRMFNSAFDDATGNTLDFYPEALRADIDMVNADVYEHINNGVYKTGFATTQAAYDEAFTDLFDALDRVEQRLSSSSYLVGDSITEADWRLFTTLIRFDAVYYGHFKCNHKQIAEYPHMSRYLKGLYNQPNIKETVNIKHIKRHYYYSHESINPTRIVPKGLPKIFKKRC